MGISSVYDHFCSNGNGAPASDEELLAAVLSEDNDPDLRDRLLKRFGDLPSIMHADFVELLKVTGSNIEARKLKAIFELATRLTTADKPQAETFHDCPSLVRYLQSAMGKNRVETLRVLFLDTHNRLISDQLMWEGTINEVQIYPREILRRALDLDSSAFLVAHNHPSQIVTPSVSDTIATKKLIAASQSLGVTFHDHLIVSKTAFHSLRFHGSVSPWE